MIAVTFRRQSGQCHMVVDAAEFHNYLRTLNATVNADTNAFEGGPPGSTGPYLDSYSSKVRAVALLSGVGQGPITIDLGQYYSRPLNIEQLKALAASVSDLASSIVEHYRPIEISVRIVGKKTPEPALESQLGG